MKNLLITGAGPHSFIGRNLKEYFLGGEGYRVFTPTHEELELLDSEKLKRYVFDNHVELIIHAAVHVPRFNGADNELRNDLTMFLNIQKIAGEVEKVLYFGSGAEFDKRSDIVMAGEDDFGKSIPDSEYGMAKYIMNMLARQSENIYNLRLFGVFGRYELWDVKFISNLCCKALFDLPLTIRQDCLFDYVYIDDLMRVVGMFLECNPQYHDYNAVSGCPVRLTEIAQLIKEISGKDLPVRILDGGMNKAYTASNIRLTEEFGFKATPLKQSAQRLYSYYESIKEQIDIEVLEMSR